MTAAELQEQEWEYSMEASCIEIYNNQLRYEQGMQLELLCVRGPSWGVNI